jgi:predicted permease
MYMKAGSGNLTRSSRLTIWSKQMLVWAALPVLVFAGLASGPFRDSIPAAVETFAQVAAVLSLFILVCAVEAGGKNQDRGK